MIVSLCVCLLVDSKGILGIRSCPTVNTVDIPGETLMNAKPQGVCFKKQTECRCPALDLCSLFNAQNAAAAAVAALALFTGCVEVSIFTAGDADFIHLLASC